MVCQVLTQSMPNHKGSRKKCHCQSNSCSSDITSTGPSAGNRPSFPTPSPKWHSLPKCQAVTTACPNVKLSPQPAQMSSCHHSLPKCQAVATDPSLASFRSRDQRYLYKATTVTPLLVMLTSLWFACNNYRK